MTGHAGVWAQCPGLVDDGIKLWREGYSATRIAAILGHGLTRNAVIGKMHRIGESGRGEASYKHPRRTRLRKPRPPKAQSPPRRRFEFGNPALRNLYLADTEPYVAPAEELVIPPAERMSILTRDDRGRLCANEAFHSARCRWPIGDPQDADFHFCGKLKVTGLPYCEHHARRAFQPPQPKRSGPRPMHVYSNAKMDFAHVKEFDELEPA